MTWKFGKWVLVPFNLNIIIGFLGDPLTPDFSCCIANTALIVEQYWTNYFYSACLLCFRSVFANISKKLRLIALEYLFTVCFWSYLFNCVELLVNLGIMAWLAPSFWLILYATSLLSFLIDPKGCDWCENHSNSSTSPSHWVPIIRLLVSCSVYTEVNKFHFLSDDVTTF